MKTKGEFISSVAIAGPDHIISEFLSIERRSATCGDVALWSGVDPIIFWSWPHHPQGKNSSPTQRRHCPWYAVSTPKYSSFCEDDFAWRHFRASVVIGSYIYLPLNINFTKFPRDLCKIYKIFYHFSNASVWISLDRFLWMLQGFSWY